MGYTNSNSRLLPQVAGQLKNTDRPNPRARINLFYEPVLKRRSPNQWAVINDPYIARLIPALKFDYFANQALNRVKISIARYN